MSWKGQDSTDTFVIFATKSFTAEADLQANVFVLQSGRALFRWEDYYIVYLENETKIQKSLAPFVDSGFFFTSQK